MRLLDTNNLKLEEFFASRAVPNFEHPQLTQHGFESTQIPTYAILSHVWGPEEVSFQDMTGDRKLVESKKGFLKVRDSCAQARRDGFAYMWIDTCCIDKTSSTELSEAINSMYAWYKDSTICYAYLSDVYENSRNLSQADFQQSRWFTRGWTLQELLAPSKMQFFNRSWEPIGNKADLMEEISQVTNIDLYALKGGDLKRLSIARRMSWASNRQTTRVEDTAYCLLGIFDINMPLLYGEGDKSFIRLQEEIMKGSDDQSLFAWRDPSIPLYRDDYPEASQLQGLLAPYPELFGHSSNTSQFYAEVPGRAVSTATNKGHRVEFLMCQDLNYPSGLIYMAILICSIGVNPGHLAAIPLRRLSPISEQFTRIDASQLFNFAMYKSSNERPFMNYQFPNMEELHGFDPTKPQSELIETNLRIVLHNWEARSVFIQQETQLPLLPPFWLAPYIQNVTLKYDLDVHAVYPPHTWDPKTRTLQAQLDSSHGTKKIAALLVTFGSTEFYGECILILGVTYWLFTPWCVMINSKAREVRTDPQSDFYKIYHFSKREEFFRSFRNKSYIKAAQEKSLLLKREFDKFNVGSVTLPTDMETKRHVDTSMKLAITTNVEHMTVSGKEMYVLYLSHLQNVQSNIFRSREN